MLKIDSSNFTYELWESASIFELFGFHLRLVDLKGSKFAEEIKKYAIGYCDAECLQVRPKTEMKAVMYEKNGIVFWSHMLNEEFAIIFGGN